MDGRLQSYSETRGYAPLAPATQPGDPRNDYRLESPRRSFQVFIHSASTCPTIVTIVPSSNAHHKRLVTAEKQSEREGVVVILVKASEVERREGGEEKGQL